MSGAPAALAALGLAGVWFLSRPGSAGRGGVLSGWSGRDRGGAARWARGRDVRALTIPGPVPGRLTLGTAGRRLLAVEPGHSLIVIGPTRSGKTTGLAVPALLEWEGPVLAASVKSDLARDSLAWRRRQGQVWVYDPSGSTGLPAARWSPLDGAGTWAGARRVAAGLVETARTSGGGLSDSDFWYATAAKLLGPLLLAAARSGRSMADVAGWVDDQEADEVADILAGAGEFGALRAARAAWGRDERQRSAVYTTAETILEVFADPAVAASARPGPGADRIDPAALLRNHGTLYLCAPAHDQRRLRPLFAGLVTQVLEAAYDEVARTGRPLDPPLLVLLDEAANVAPVAELDVLASTAAGHGIQLVTVWQDLAQLTARYGPRSGTVVNNHRAKLFLSGIADPATLDHASQLIGDGDHPMSSTTVDGRGQATTTTQLSPRRLLPPDALRRLPPNTGVLITGHHQPTRLTLRPWYRNREHRRRRGV